MSDDNYYKVGGSLEYQHPTYVVRQADSDLYEGLTNGDFCYVLNSRQMGKSSLRVQMMKKLKEQGVKCASIDMTRIGSHVTPQEWYAGVVSELLRGFGLSKKVDFSTWWRQRELLPPLQRLRELIEDVLLAECSQKLVIFIDEIDSIIKIKFKEDFFAFIRACYNQRVDNPEYNRLTFCLLGVATPSDLIEDKNVSTPFNIGRAIELTGFQLHEAMPLAQGLLGKTSNPQTILREVLAWTGGQPFLTQKVCKLVLSAEESIPAGGEAVWVENLVRARIIENWETTDEPEHLRTIRDRLCRCAMRNRILWSDRSSQLLRLYEQILQQGEIKANDKPEHMELRLSGLVVKQQGKLRVYNRIYESVFNQSWVENALVEAGLLPEAVEKSPPSQAEIQVLEQAGVNSLKRFKYEQIEGLVLAMQAGQTLKAVIADSCPLQDYPTISPLLALQSILDNIRQQNQLNSYQSKIYIHDVRFSPDGQKIVTVEDDGTIQLWKRSGQLLLRWKGHWGAARSVSFSPDGQLLATAGRDGKARLWNLSGQLITEFDDYQGWGLGVCFSPDGQLFAIAGGSSTVRVWNLLEQQVTEFDGHRGSIWSVSFSPDGQQLATAGMDGNIRRWNLSGQQIDQFKPHQGKAWSVSFSPDGQQLATAGNDDTAKLWNLSGQLLAQLNGHEGFVRSVSFSPNGQLIATGGYDGTARIWSLSGQPLAQLNGHQAPVLSVSFSPNEQLLITAGADGTARLWNLSDKHLAQWNTHQGKVYCLTFTLSQKHIFTVGSDGTIRLWDLSGQQLAQLSNPNGWVRSASFSPGMHYLVTAGADGKVRLWRVTWQLSNTDLQSIITSSDRNNRLWEIKNLHDGNLGNCDYLTTFWYEFQYSTWVNSVNFSPSWQGVDTERIATAGADGTVCIWNLTGHQLAQWNTNRGELLGVSFHPDGQRIGTAGVDGTVCLWDLSGHNLACWHTHQGKVTSVTFSPDGQIIATAGEDGTAKLWTISGHLLAEFKDHQGGVRSVSFCGSGKLIAIAGDASTVQLWRVEGLDELLARGCDWLKDYFVTHPEALEKLEVCQNRFKSIEADRNLNIADDVEGTSGKTLPKRIAQSQKTPEVPPALDCAPKTEVRQLAAKTLVAVIGEMLARQGDIEKAVAAYTEAQTLDPKIDIPATVGNNLCWWGSLWGRAADVMDACETAVALEPENGMFRDSRGLARALTGDIAGAIEDFQAFVDWTDNEQKRLQRQRWIDALCAGENPFTQEEIERLLNEYNVAHPQVLETIKECQNRFSSVATGKNLADVSDFEDVAIASPSSAPVVRDRLSSERGIDYTQLRDLLAAGQWQEADQETTAIMLRISGREAEGWLTQEDIENFPCTDLLTIDQLWVKYSQGRFGFSIQKKIWQSVGGRKNAYYEVYCIFCKRIGWGNHVGWRQFSWLSSCDLTFNTTAPVGHLPGGLLDWLWSSYRQSRLNLWSSYKPSQFNSRDESDDRAAFRGWWNIISSIASRLEVSNMESPAPTTVARRRLVTTASNESEEGFLGEFLVHDKVVRIYQGDITDLVTDVIVSSDDNHLTMGGGVSKRIRRVGGDEIYWEASNLIPLSLGEVAVTTAGKLCAKKIFHSVVIDFEDREGPSREVIQRVIHTCIKKASIYRFCSIAFPLVGTGAGRFPVKLAWKILLNQIIRDLSDETKNIIRVIIVIHDKKVVEELKIQRFLERIGKKGVVNPDLV